MRHLVKVLAPVEPDIRRVLGLHAHDVIAAVDVVAFARDARGQVGQQVKPRLADIVLGHVSSQRGSFGDMMTVRSVNDGPICMLLDSKRVF